MAKVVLLKYLLASAIRAKAYYGQGDNEQAVKYTRMSLQLDPDNKKAFTLLRLVQKLVRTKEEGNAAFKAKDYKRAVELYTQGLEIDPTNKDTNSKLLQNRAQAHIALKDYEKAIEDCTEDPCQSPRRRRKLARGYQGLQKCCRSQPQRERYPGRYSPCRIRAQEEPAKGLLQDSRCREGCFRW